MNNEKIIPLKQAKKEARELYNSGCTWDGEVTLQEYIEEYIEVLEEDGYIIK